MKEGYHGNILLIEIILVILFFSIASTISVGVLVKARQTERQTRCQQESVQTSEDLFALLSGTPDPVNTLENAGFSHQDDRLVRSDGIIQWDASITEKETDSGSLFTVLLSGVSDSMNQPAEFSMVYYLPKEAVNP